jgi:hypothetical protein
MLAEKRITKCMRYEIIKPTSCTWDEFGKVLNELRYECARIANYTIQKCWEWENFNRKKKTITDIYPLTKEKPNIYMLLRERFPNVGTGVINQVRQYAEKRFKQDRKDMFLLKKSVPSFRDTMPIMLTNQAFIVKHTDGYEIDAMLLPSDFSQYRFSFLVKYGENNKRSILDKLISGEYKQGAIQFIRDSHRKWYAIISFSFQPQTKEFKDSKCLEVVWKNEKEKEITIKISGTQFERFIPINDINESMNRFEARLLDIKKQRKYRNVITKGHGREKLIEPAQRIQEKIRNFKLTANHRLSKIIIDIAIKQKCSSIVISGDFLENWPVYDLESKIRYKAEQVDIIVGH